MTETEARLAADRVYRDGWVCSDCPYCLRYREWHDGRVRHLRECLMSEVPERCPGLSEDD